MQVSPINRDARRLRQRIIVASIVLALLYVAARLGLRVGPVVVQQRPAADALANQPLIGDAVMILLAAAIFCLTEALRGIIDGGLFSPVVVKRFRRFAAWLMVMALIRFFAPVIAHAAQGTPGKQGHIILILDVPDLILVGITLLLFLIARMFERARAIEDEMSEIV